MNTYNFDATNTASDINNLVTKLLAAESQIEHGYAQLGSLLNQMSENKHWKTLGHKSFGAYLKELGDKYDKKRTQLYNYFSTVRELSPYVTEEQLNLMGIAKAYELKKSISRTGFPPAAETINQAVDPKITTQQIRKLLFEESNTNNSDKGTWFDEEGFYVTPEERLVIRSADEAALNEDPVVPKDVPAWVQRKEARLRQAMEFLSTHSGE